MPTQIKQHRPNQDRTFFLFSFFLFFFSFLLGAGAVGVKTRVEKHCLSVWPSGKALDW